MLITLKIDIYNLWMMLGNLYITLKTCVINIGKSLNIQPVPCVTQSS